MQAQAKEISQELRAKLWYVVREAMLYAWEWLDFQMGVNIRENPETSFFWDGDVDRLVPRDDDYVEAFTEGAQQIWNEIAEKI